MDERLPGLPETTLKPPQMPKKSYFNKRNVIVVLLLLLAIIGLGGFFLVRYLVTDYLIYDRPGKTLSGHTRRVFSISFSPDGNTIASGSEDKTVKLWDVATGNLKHTLTGHEDVIRSVSFSPDGQTLASAGWDDKTIKIWNAANGTLKHTEKFNDSVQSVTFSPDGQTLAVTSDAIYLLDAASGKLKSSIPINAYRAFAVAFSPDGKTLAASVFKEMKLWDSINGNLKQNFVESSEIATPIAFSPDGNTLAGGSLKGKIFLWNVADGNLKKTFAAGDDDRAVVAFSPDGKILVTGSYDRVPEAKRFDGEIEFWDAATGDFQRTFARQKTAVTSISFSPDGRTLAAGNYDGTISIWSMK